MNSCGSAVRTKRRRVWHGADFWERNSAVADEVRRTFADLNRIETELNKVGEGDYFGVEASRQIRGSVARVERRADSPIIVFFEEVECLASTGVNTPESV